MRKSLLVEVSDISKYSPNELESSSNSFLLARFSFLMSGTEIVNKIMQIKNSATKYSLELPSFRQCHLPDFDKLHPLQWWCHRVLLCACFTRFWLTELAYIYFSKRGGGIARVLADETRERSRAEERCPGSVRVTACILPALCLFCFSSGR